MSLWDEIVGAHDAHVAGQPSPAPSASPVTPAVAPAPVVQAAPVVPVVPATHAAPQLVHETSFTLPIQTISPQLVAAPASPSAPAAVPPQLSPAQAPVAESAALAPAPAAAAPVTPRTVDADSIENFFAASAEPYQAPGAVHVVRRGASRQDLRGSSRRRGAELRHRLNPTTAPLVAPRKSSREVERLLRQSRRYRDAVKPVHGGPRRAHSGTGVARRLVGLLGALTVGGFVFLASYPGLTSAAANADGGALSTATASAEAQELAVTAIDQGDLKRSGFESLTIGQLYALYGQSSIPCAVSSDGQLRWPLDMGCQISGHYGYRIDPTFGGTAFHNGTDLTPGAGVPVLSASTGIITAIEHDAWGYGTHVIISSPEWGVDFLYGHMQVDSVNHLKVGQQVQPGDRIGAVGSTGKSTGAHLHFEIRVHNAAGSYDTVNPVDWMHDHIK